MPWTALSGLRRSWPRMPIMRSRKARAWSDCSWACFACVMSMAVPVRPIDFPSASRNASKLSSRCRSVPLEIHDGLGRHPRARRDDLPDDLVERVRILLRHELVEAAPDEASRRWAGAASCRSTSCSPSVSDSKMTMDVLASATRNRRSASSLMVTAVYPIDVRNFVRCSKPRHRIFRRRHENRGSRAWHAACSRKSPHESSSRSPLRRSGSHRVGRRARAGARPRAKCSCGFARPGVGPWDGWIRSGKSVLPQPLPLTLGSDHRRVSSKRWGRGVSFAVGDEVFGVTNKRFTNANAEYAIALAAMIATKPSVDRIRARCFGAGGGRDRAPDARRSRRPRGGADGRGSWRSAGNVGRLCRDAREVARRACHRDRPCERDGCDLRALGADVVVDVTTTRLEDVARDVDVVLDTIGPNVHDASFAVLKPSGILVSSVTRARRAGRCARSSCSST